jgi:predicted XRE-type DNA-binding protein
MRMQKKRYPTTCRLKPGSFEDEPSVIPELNTKLSLATEINKLIRRKHLGQIEAARVLGVTQPKVSALANYKLSGFSVERLMEFVTALGLEVNIVIRRTSRNAKARIHVTAA